MESPIEQAAKKEKEDRYQYEWRLASNEKLRMYGRPPMRVNPRGIIASHGYDGNAGFFNEDKKEWVSFPKEVRHRLQRLTTMEVSFWQRLHFLFHSKHSCEIEKNTSRFADFHKGK